MKHRSAVRSSAAFLTAMLMAVPARAGEGPTAEAGQRVRVTAAVSGLHGVVVGTLLKVGPETLTVADSERGALTELPLASITRLEVSQGRRRHTRGGLLLGMDLVELNPILDEGNRTARLAVELILSAFGKTIL